MRLILVLALAAGLVGCGPECDDVVAGTCLVFNGHPVDVGMAAVALGAAEDSTSEAWGGFALSDEADSEGLTATWVAEIGERKGEYASNAIRVMWAAQDAGSAGDVCVDRYYVLAHEALHFAAERHFGDPDAGHSRVDLWFQAAWDDGAPISETIEYGAYLPVLRRCSGR